MKPTIHPTYYPEARVACACGNSFTIGSTVPEIHIEMCHKCHPFYTQKQKLVDTARRVERFTERVAKREAAAAARKGRVSGRVKRAEVKAKKAPKAEKEE